jgi:hypothetical protein
MDSDQNKKKGRRKTPINDNKISSLDRAQIKELLADSIENYVVKLNKESKDVAECVELLDGYVSEFLQAFIIFGYDMKGRPVCMHHANNQMDGDALNSLINRVIFNRGE